MTTVDEPAALTAMAAAMRAQAYVLDMAAEHLRNPNNEDEPVEYLGQFADRLLASADSMTAEAS